MIVALTSVPRVNNNLYERLSGRGTAPTSAHELTSRDVAEAPGEPRQFVTKRIRPPLVAALAVGIVVLVLAVIFTATRLNGVAAAETTPAEMPSEENVAPAGADSSIPTTTATTLVHVVGAVKKSGVYELKPGARVIDALEAAGGASDDAALAAVNLARLVTDGEQLRVPTSAEAAATAPAVTGATGGGDAQSASSQLLNINSASADQLEELPRVGPALASRIIDYRTANGAFQSVDDLNAVSGIGDKLLDSIRDLVTV